ncbi:MAG: hypothetical protein J6W81_05990 [Lentisphaeria bacterium]|nr:hypothetical protein [Lentisphaeria bacterium]
MKLTREITKVLQECIQEGFDSVSEFAKFANVSTETVTRYLQSETASIRQDTWNRIQPLLKLYKTKERKEEKSHHKPPELNSDQKILLDAFNALPPDVQRQKLMEIIDIARKTHRKQMAEQAGTAQ